MRKLLLTSLLALLSASCTPLGFERGLYLQDYRAGSFEEAGVRVGELLEKKGKNEEAWLRLDRAMTSFAAGRPAESIEDFNLALEAIDYYNASGFMETLGQSLFYDGAGPWRGEDYEQLLARLYFALALLHKGDESNAFALLRQAEEWRQEKEEEYRLSPATSTFGVTENKLGRLLFGFLLQKRGDRSSAELLLEEPLAEDKATLLVLCHNGLAPKKYSRILEGSQASALALELFLNSNLRTRAYSTLVGIPVPELAFWPPVQRPQTVEIDGQNYPLTELFDIGRAAALEVSQKRPLIIARGVARLALRRGVTEAARRSNQDLAPYIDLGMVLANACTQADTRSWGLLPESLDYRIAKLDPGLHTFKMGSEYTLRLKKGDLCVIHIFNQAPGMARVLVPQHFQERPCY